MSALALPTPVRDERTLQQLEEEFLRSTDVWPSDAGVSLSETLAPAIGRVADDSVCRMSKRRTINYCCDTR